MDEVFDSALRETAERIFPLAVTDIVGREDQGVTQRLAPIREHDEFFTYLVRATTAGTFIAAPTHAEEMYEPEVFGRTATSVVEVAK